MVAENILRTNVGKLFFTENKKNPIFYRSRSKWVSYTDQITNISPNVPTYFWITIYCKCHDILKIKIKLFMIKSNLKYKN